MSFSNPHARVLPEQPLRAPQRAAGDVHLIAPDDGTKDLHKNNGRTSSSTQDDDDDNDGEKDLKFFYRAVTALQDAGSVVACVASSVIQREASSVNYKLLRVQDRLHRQKRRRLSATSSDEPDRTTMSSSTQDKKRDLSAPTYPTAVSEQENVSIWNQAARTKRMSILLRDLEMTHSLLLREIAAASMAASSNNIPDSSL
jgi:hypothetical protein